MTTGNEKPPSGLGMAAGDGLVAIHNQPHFTPSGAICQDLLTVALSYAARGWPVFPVWPPNGNGTCTCGDPECDNIGKHPLGRLAPNGLKDATTDPALIRKWWTAAPHANIGLPCGPAGLVVIDVDVKYNGREHWAELCRQHVIDLRTPTSHTPSGGRHLVYAAYDGCTLSNTTGKLAPGVDTRAGPGYIVAPPSKHHTGNLYAWDSELNPDRIQPAPLPDALRRLLADPPRPVAPRIAPAAVIRGNGVTAYGRKALDEECAIVRGILEGQRNHQLNRSAFALGELVAGGELDQTDAERELLTAALASGLREREAVKTIASGLQDGQQNPRSAPGKTHPTPQPRRDATDEPPAFGDNLPEEPPATATVETKPQPRTPGKKIRSTDLIDFLAGLGYAFRLNLCDDSIEVNGVRVTDVIRSKMRCQLRDAGLGKFLAAAEDATVANAATNAYHPVQAYLEGLSWDGGEHIAQLASHVTDVNGVFGLYLRKWLIGSIARAYTGSQNAVLVLDGPQGLGKSQFVRWLCPLPALFVDATVEPDAKDCSLLAIRSWIWEVSELGATTKRADVEALKGFLSREVFTLRPPYGHFEIVKAGLASFVGTVNNSSGIFSDPTGSRRYWATTLTRLDWAYTHNVNLPQVWAEAYVGYRCGESWTLTPAEAATARAINDDFAVVDVYEDLLRAHFTLDPARVDKWTASADILTTLQPNGLGMGTPTAHAMHLGATLRRLGHAKKKVGDVNGYVGVWAN